LVELANGDVVVQANVSDGQGGAPIPDTAQGPAGTRANGTDVVLIRFDKNGELVTSFGESGIAKVEFGWKPSDDASWPVPTYDSSKTPATAQYSWSGFPSDSAWSLLLDTSGGEEKLVVTGFGPAKKVASGSQRVDNDRYVAKLLASTGAPDPTFNSGEAYTFGTPGTLSDGARHGAIEADGTILSAGYTNLGEGLGNHVLLLRLNPDGTPDASFGFGEPSIPGVAVFNPLVVDGGVSEGYGVARDANGRYITTGYGRATAEGQTSSLGYATTADGPDLVSIAVKSDGTGIDTSWGNQGTRVIQSEEFGLSSTEDRGRDIAALPDGRVIQAGAFGSQPALFVLTPEGELDESVGEQGRFVYDAFSGETAAHFFRVTVSPDGQHIAAATGNHADGARLAVLALE